MANVLLKRRASYCSIEMTSRENQHAVDYRGRSFLFLQGPASPFFTALGRHLRDQGAKTLRVNFCPGDAFYWSGPAVAFRGRREDLGDFYEDLFHRHAFTDVIIFGDTRAVHHPARAVAAARGVRVHVFEEGYLRPDWITLERGGVNAHSPLPRDPAWYRRAAEVLVPPVEPEHTRTNQTLRALEDMAFHAANLAAPLFYPRYQTHRPRPPALEYAGWIRRFGMMPLISRQEAARIEAILADRAPLFFFPLQLSGDSQITTHSKFDHMGEAMTFVVESFARHAPRDARLLIKNHPFDTGLDGHGGQARQLADELGVGGRVFFFESGHVPTITDQADGTVVVNSTVGLAALGHNCPVKTLAEAIYDLPGLTFQGGLDEFWNNPTPPDRSLYTAFRRVLLATTQVNGNFFTLQGIRLAVQGCDRMLAEDSPLEVLKQQVNDQRKQIDVVQT
jgi:capsular polysaccharide export protein